MEAVRGLFSRINRLIPEIEKPAKRPTLKEKLAWTAIVLILYYLLTQVPIYGIPKETIDYLAGLRVIFAGASGSIVELGIGPVVTAGIVMELLIGSNILKLDLTDPEDRKFFQEAQRVAAVFFIVLENGMYALGRYPVGGTLQLFIIAQLCIGSFLLMMLDDLTSKWGIGSGISLFILAGVAQRVLWEMFTPLTTSGGRVIGVIPALIKEGIVAVYRPGMPNLLGLVATFVVFLIVVWAYSIRVEIPIAHTMVGGQKMKYPIRLLYVSNVPIIFAAALIGDIEMISRVLWMRMGSTATGVLKWIIDFLGTWRIESNGMIPVSGLAYYLQRPFSPEYLFLKPDASLVYLVVMVLGCILFAKVWVMTAGMDAAHVADQLVKQGIVIPGRRASTKIMRRTVENYINTVTILGGLLVGLLAALADFSGALGTGSGILLAVTIVASFYEALAKERAMEIYPRLKKFFVGR